MEEVEVKKEGKKYYVEIPERHIKSGKIKVGEKYRIAMFSLKNGNKNKKKASSEI